MTDIDDETFYGGIVLNTTYTPDNDDDYVRRIQRLAQRNQHLIPAVRHTVLPEGHTFGYYASDILGTRCNHPAIQDNPSITCDGRSDHAGDHYEHGNQFTWTTTAPDTKTWFEGLKQRRDQVD